MQVEVRPFRYFYQMRNGSQVALRRSHACKFGRSEVFPVRFQSPRRELVASNRGCLFDKALKGRRDRASWKHSFPVVSDCHSVRRYQIRAFVAMKDSSTTVTVRNRDRSQPLSEYRQFHRIVAVVLCISLNNGKISVQRVRRSGSLRESSNELSCLPVCRMLRY
jgi:hypothetical protein